MWELELQPYPVLYHAGQGAVGLVSVPSARLFPLMIERWELALSTAFSGRGLVAQHDCEAPCPMLSWEGEQCLTRPLSTSLWEPAPRLPPPKWRKGVGVMSLTA